MNILNDWDDLLNTDEQVEIFTLLYFSLEEEKKKIKKKGESKNESRII